MKTIKGFFFLANLWLKDRAKFNLIYKCYEKQRAENSSPFTGKLKFTLHQYAEFWTAHKLGDVYTMSSRDGSVVECRVAYYPMPDYADLRALVEIQMPKGTDFREVPVHYLIRKNQNQIT